ncbi:hypothetical protein SAMN05444372_10259 [Flavobacterium micromati]|uniref:Uncharacterized protein n=1 Tax=Flavobacterium micromati TaxID=229205 RepID=A0A1M5GM62_9FLAO|nr:hypothetical protein [Flavobacterium micromati]SHG04797.1 hypothetical protein SAMN05444372_10259 [Flavobacterium micromati]
MELSRIELLLEKYFDAETSLIEEKELHDYFCSQDIAPHLFQYRSIFGYLAAAKTDKFTKSLPKLKEFSSEKGLRKLNFYAISVAASVVVMIGIGSYIFYSSQVVKNTNELGTYNDPKVALAATQKALSLLSSNVNVGIKTVHYIGEYQVTKNKIFRKAENNSEGL